MPKDTIIHGGGTANLGGVIKRVTLARYIPIDLTRFVAPIACITVAAGLLAACSATTFERDVGYLKPAASDLSKIEALLEVTPKGKAIVDWFRAEEAGALAAVEKFNAKVGLTVENVKFACAADETVHALIKAAEWVATIPSQAVLADDLGYRAIQGACKLAAAGKLPSTADAGKVVGMFKDTAVALGAK